MDTDYQKAACVFYNDGLFSSVLFLKEEFHIYSSSIYTAGCCCLDLENLYCH